MIMMRQGDVCLVRCRKPSKSTLGQPQELEHGRIVLTHGEATGHAHAIEGLAELYGPESATRHLHMLKGGRLLHEEHAPLEIPPGWWKVLRQREYADGYIRRVAD